jgi:DNA-directed RNA polymerase subunit RPC12/RpoP
MSKMSGINRLPVELYRCSHCSKEYDANMVEDTWRCPKCNNFIVIYAEDTSSNTRIVLLRKRADELKTGDLIHLPGRLTKETNEVLAVQKNDHGKLEINLKNYRKYEREMGDPINCREGGDWEPF